VHLSHDLALLRLIEGFSESAPQLVLMQTVLLHTGEWRDPVTGEDGGGVATTSTSTTSVWPQSWCSVCSSLNVGAGAVVF